MGDKPQGPPLQAYLKTRNEDDLCLICGEELGRDVSVISKDLKAWENLKDHTKAWKDVPLKPGEPFCEFTLVHRKVDGIEIPFGKRHRSFNCKGNFAKTSLCDKMKIEDRGIKSTITQSHALKDVIVERFPDSIRFFKSWRDLIVHS